MFYDVVGNHAFEFRVYGIVFFRHRAAERFAVGYFIFVHRAVIPADETVVCDLRGVGNDCRRSPLRGDRIVLRSDSPVDARRNERNGVSFTLVVDYDYCRSVAVDILLRNRPRNVMIDRGRGYRSGRIGDSGKIKRFVLVDNEFSVRVFERAFYNVRRILVCRPFCGERYVFGRHYGEFGRVFRSAREPAAERVSRAGRNGKRHARAPYRGNIFDVDAAVRVERNGILHAVVISRGSESPCNVAFAFDSAEHGCVTPHIVRVILTLFVFSVVVNVLFCIIGLVGRSVFFVDEFFGNEIASRNGCTRNVFVSVFAVRTHYVTMFFVVYTSSGDEFEIFKQKFVGFRIFSRNLESKRKACDLVGVEYVDLRFVRES